MLLIAVSGAKGSGKTTLLARLAAWFEARATVVDGFLAEAGARSSGTGGADRYDLRWLRNGETTPLAERDAALSPPYRFNPEAWNQVRHWAQGIRPHLPLIVLDEFGRLESEGKGHVEYWPLIVAAQPEVVAIAVRQGCEEAIEYHLGRRFDLGIDVAEQDAWERLRAACLAHADWMRVGVYGAAAGTLEVSLGSVMHGAQVPMRGLVMSSLQGATLVRAGEGLGERMRVTWVAFIAAGLKALSPAGSRLRPMIGITMQGILFGFLTRLLGWNPLGLFVGAWAVGAWAMAQGLVFNYLLLGTDLLKAYESVVAWTARHWGVSPPAISTAIAIWITACGLVAGAIALLARQRARAPVWLLNLIEQRTVAVSPRANLNAAPKRKRTALLLSLRDVLTPSFWLPVLLVAAILLAAGSSWESLFWMAARAVTVAVVLFSLVHVFDFPGFLDWLRRRGHWGPAAAFHRALRKAKG